MRFALSLHVIYTNYIIKRLILFFSDILTERLLTSGKDRREFLTGTSSILFVYIDDEEDLIEAETRLKNLVYAMPRMPPGTYEIKFFMDLLRIFLSPN